MSYRATDWADGVVLKKVSWEGSVDKRTDKKNSVSPCVGLQKLILLLLCKRMNDKTKRCFPSLETLVDVSGLSKPTVINCIKALEIQGVLKIERGKISNNYLINIDGDFNGGVEYFENPKPEPDLTADQIECWELAKKNSFWQNKVATQGDFLKTYLRPNSGLKTQYEDGSLKFEVEEKPKRRGKKSPADFEEQDFDDDVPDAGNGDFIDGEFEVVE